MHKPIKLAKPGFVQIWWTAIRPRTLGMALAPVALGNALAAVQTRLDLLILAATLGCALLIQIGTNLYNDAVDFERGTDRPERLGPLRVTLAGWASARAVKRAAGLCLLLTLLLGIGLVLVGGWLILAIGLASLVAGWAYSGGRHPISHTPFGELFVLVFFGVLAVAGSHWLQSRQLLWADLLAGLAIGAPAAAVLLINNFRDLATDRQAGRRTLAACLGAQATRRVFAALLAAPIPLLLTVAANGYPGALLGLACWPVFLPLIRQFQGGLSGAALNQLLAATARNGSLLGILAALGIALQVAR